MITETFKQELNKQEIDLKEYLKEGYSLNNDDKENSSILKAMDYYKKFLPIQLKNILFNNEYWELTYNSSMVNFIKDKLGLNDKNDLKAIDTFVYTYQCYKREFEEKENKENLRIKLVNEGFKEQELFIKTSEFEFKDLTEELKKLDGLKVTCVMDFNKIGILGSFRETDKREGTLKYSEYHKSLMLIPKRSRTKGFLIMGKFYYKELKGGIN